MIQSLHRLFKSRKSAAALKYGILVSAVAVLIIAIGVTASALTGNEFDPVSTKLAVVGSCQSATGADPPQHEPPRC